MYHLGDAPTAAQLAVPTIPPRTLLTPVEAERALQETIDAWNTLRNEAYGRGVTPRQDVPGEIQDTILHDYDSFRAFVGRLTAFDTLINDYSAELSDWRRIYENDRALWMSQATSSAPRLTPTFGPGESVINLLARAGQGATNIVLWPLLITGGIVLIALGSWRIYLSHPRQPTARRRFAFVR